jgi:CarboxypepD_reg-like domain
VVRIHPWQLKTSALWPRGQVQVCKTFYVSSNLTRASFFLKLLSDLTMILSYREINEVVLPTIIEGIVIDKKSNNPVSRTHVYIENSEEESLTTTEGEFKILSWQKFPVTLIIKHVYFEPVRITVTACAQRILVFLKEK